MWRKEKVCHECNLVIAIGSDQDHVGNFWFHTDSFKRCFQKFLARHHDSPKERVPCIRRPAAGVMVQSRIKRLYR